MDFLLLVGVLIAGLAITAVARRAGGPSTDRFVNLDPTRSDYSIIATQRASEVGETDRHDEEHRIQN